MAEPHPIRALQELDSAADDFRAEREGLPERAALEANLAEVEALAQQRLETSGRLDALRKDERALEAEVADVAARNKHFEDDLYSGKVTSPKELETLQGELATSKLKQDELEERELELMESGEGLEGEIAAMDERRAALATEEAALRARIAEEEARIDGELAALAGRRDEVVAPVTPDLLVAYDKLRGFAPLRGVVMSHLKGNACGTCRTVIPVMDLSRIKAGGAGSFSPCPGCRRLILVD